MRGHYEGQTMGELHFGLGHQRLDKKQVAYRTLPPWKRATEGGA